jgi:arabinofuranosyltransferase
MNTRIEIHELPWIAPASAIEHLRANRSSRASGAATSEGLAGLSLAVLGLFGAYYLWNSLYYFPYVVDDAFISLRYAYNFVHGLGLAYNPGQPVEGFSNFLWVMIESAVLALGLPGVSSIKLISMTAGLGAVVGSYALARRIFAGQDGAELKSLLGVALLATNTSVAVWSQAGLETVWLMFLLVATGLRFEVELQRTRALPLSALLFGLAWMTRPEVPIYSLYILGRRLFALREKPWSVSDLWWVLAAAAIVIPYECWGLWYFGKLFPTTHAAKVAEAGLERFSPRRLMRQPELFQFLTRQGIGLPIMIVLGILGSVIGRKRTPPAVWLIPLCGMIFVLYARFDWMPRNRFFVPFLPFLCLLIAHGLVELRERARRQRFGPLAWTLVCVVLFVDYAGTQSFAGEPRSPGSEPKIFERESKMPTQERGFWFSEVPARLFQRDYPLENSANFILSNIPEGEPVVLRDIGFPGYLGMNPIWDTAGLVTPTAAKARRDRSDEMQQKMFDELLELRPGCFRLIMPRERDNHINRRLQEWLESDPVASRLYRRVRPVGDLKKDFYLAVYLRNDLGGVDYEARLAAALERLPEYRARAISRAETPPTKRTKRRRESGS